MMMSYAWLWTFLLFPDCALAARTFLLMSNYSIMHHPQTLKMRGFFTFFKLFFFSTGGLHARFDGTAAWQEQT